jgi:hypothetical protein
VKLADQQAHLDQLRAQVANSLVMASEGLALYEINLKLEGDLLLFEQLACISDGRPQVT